jgi:anti-sigma regulatory factor (Ser/Thr protein kinase)
MSMLGLVFAANSGAPAAARNRLHGLGLSDVQCDAVRLLTSELVTNSVRHAALGPRQLIRLRVLVTDRTVRIEVVDGGAGLRVAMRGADSTGGWGLRLVDALADRWGGARDHGAHVWFELDRARARDSDPHTSAVDPGI